MQRPSKSERELTNLDVGKNEIRTLLEQQMPDNDRVFTAVLVGGKSLYENRGSEVMPS